MSRTLGFILGSVVVFALLVFVLGRPVSLAPPSRDSGFGPGSFTTTAPVRIPLPVARPDAVPEQQDVAKPAPVAEAEAVAELPESPGESVASTVVVAEPEPIARPVVVEYQDENALAENWLASTTGQTLDNAVPAETQGDVDALANAGVTSLPNDLAGAAPVAVQTGELEWFPVWDPFHSELSANAFARRLERVTGLDYRVMKTDATQYRVVMGYTSEEQRIVNVEMIEQATGLSITGGSR